MWKPRAKTLAISEKETTYKVKYLGNVLTAFMKGEGCIDRPASILWNNYNKNKSSPLNMDLTICSTGLKVLTLEQGLTEYRFHRISYCCIYSQSPKIFIWVYRHEGKKMKVELRCHAVLCKTEAHSSAMVDQLHQRLEFALAEFTREKTRRQNSRLLLQAHSFDAPPLPSPKCQSPRTKFLTVGQNFKPPNEQSTSAPKLQSITEDAEENDGSAGNQIFDVVDFMYTDDSDSLGHDNSNHSNGCLEASCCDDVFTDNGFLDNNRPVDTDSGESGFSEPNILDY